MPQWNLKAFQQAMRQVNAELRDEILEKMDLRFVEVKRDIAHLGDRMSGMEGRMDHMEGRMDHLGGRMYHLIGRFDNLQKQISHVIF